MYIYCAMRRKSLRSSRGFTIVELMIALTIISIILVMATTIMIQIGNIYTKGINQANLQNATRNTMADISSSLQFSGNTPYPATCSATACFANSQPNAGGTYYSFCMGSVRYSYVLNREVGIDPANPLPAPSHVLWRDTMVNSANCQPLNVFSPSSPLTDVADPTGNGYDMVPPHMRLTRFTITEQSTGVYTIDIGMAYGDSDLVHTDLATGHSTCSGGAGTQFCAISEISNTVLRRIE